MIKKNFEFPFDYYINYLLKNKISKRKYQQLSKEVYGIINQLKKNNPSIIKSKILGNIIVTKEDNGKKRNFYDLFSFNELSLFSMYIKHKKKYKIAFDIGANLGLHSIVLSKLGYQVKSFEPDPDTYKKLKKNLKINKCKNYKLYNFAISNFYGKSNFFQIKDNLTANTLQNSSKKVYGKFKTIKVNVKKIDRYLSNENSLIKLDVEGSEYNILNSINYKKILSLKIFL